MNTSSTQDAPGPSRQHDAGAPLARLRYFTPLVLLVWMVILAALFLLGREKSAICENAFRAEELRKVYIEDAAIAHIFEMIISDITFLASHEATLATLDAASPQARAKGTSRVEELFLSFSGTRHMYDQLRLLDSEGMEVARINYNNNTPTIVDAAGLQNKCDRYYFKDTLELERGRFYLSPLDLNVEGGVVEQPFKPMLRVGMPIYGDGEKPCGIIMVNYLAGQLLRAIEDLDQSDRGETSLINNEGYWLLGSDQNRNWGFMLPEREDMTFQNLYEREWALLEQQDRGQFKTGNGIFTFAKIYPTEEARDAAESLASGKPHLLHAPSMDMTPHAPDSIHWTLVSRVPPEVADQCSATGSPLLLFVGTLLLLISALAAWYVASILARRAELQRKLLRMAQFDALTGLPNRVLFHDRLGAALRSAKRENKHCALLYIDLDGFKAINDNFGHQAGDEVLQNVARVLEASTRKSDTTARLGGDEFAAILPNVASPEDAHSVGEKIIENIRTDPALQFGGQQVGASIGLAVYPADATDDEKLMMAADSAMYAAKQGGKNRCVAHDKKP